MWGELMGLSGLWGCLVRPVVRALDDFDRQRLVRHHEALEGWHRQQMVLAQLREVCDEIEAEVEAEAAARIFALFGSDLLRIRALPEVAHP
jgi:hypothetical protein